MPLKIAYLLMRWLFGLVALVFRGDRAKDAELLVLRQENAVLRRTAGQVRYEPADRAWFAALAQFVPRRRWAGVFPVTPATLLAWHRRLVARRYDTSARRRPGRPPTVVATYAGAISATVSYNEILRSAYDLHRFDMVKALHYKLPFAEDDEYKLFQELNTLFQALGQYRSMSGIGGTGIAHDIVTSPYNHEISKTVGRDQGD